MAERNRKKEFQKIKDNKESPVWVRYRWEFPMLRGATIIYSYIISLAAIILGLMGIAEFIISLVYYFMLNPYAKIVENHYNIKELPIYMSVNGIFVALFHLLVWHMFNTYRAAEEENSYNRRKELPVLAKWLKGLYYFSFIISALSLFTTIQCKRSLKKLETNIPQGIEYAMNKYSTDLEFKRELDSLQYQLKCCGSHNYKEWFKVSLIGTNLKQFEWYSKKIGDKFDEKTKSHFKNGQFYGHDVPFSCCNPSSMRPCIYYNIDNSLGIHNNWLNEIESIYDKGCARKIISSLETLITFIEWNRFIELSLEFLIVILLDLIQQSLTSEYINGAFPPIVRCPIVLCIIIGIILLITYFLTVF
jgi:hypothetical protein